MGGIPTCNILNFVPLFSLYRYYRYNTVPYRTVYTDIDTNAKYVNKIKRYYFDEHCYLAENIFNIGIYIHWIIIELYLKSQKGQYRKTNLFQGEVNSRTGLSFPFHKFCFNGL